MHDSGGANKNFRSRLSKALPKTFIFKIQRAAAPLPDYTGSAPACNYVILHIIHINKQIV
jgi:hypothetical protein